jgi:hypothetical protein
MTSERFADVDPFDALRGTHVPRWVRSHARLRQIATQLRKRAPIPTAWLYGIEPFVMAKTAGCFLTAAARTGDTPLADEALAALDVAQGNLGDGAWGYEFDVQTRWAFYPAGQPNLIATVFVARGWGGAGAVALTPEGFEELQASAQFLRSSLIHAGDAPFFGYTLDSPRLVHNANLLGAGLVASAAALRGDDAGLRIALDCVRTSLCAQRSDGSWPYGDAPSLAWSDNFHTAYNLDALLSAWLATGDSGCRGALDRGIEHWKRDFFGAAGEPRYYPATPYPYDIHSAATAVDLAARLSVWGWDTGELARRVHDWTLQHLIDPATLRPYYQRHRYWTDRRHFMRWGDAHWALAQSAIAIAAESRRDPLEAAVALASGVG